MRRKGFTLIELMIVVAIIAIIAAVAIPGLLRSRIGANESSAVSSLKAIATGESQFKDGNCVDINANGVGEYGYLAEAGGVAAVRGSGVTYQAAPYIPRTLGNVSATFESSKAGYHITLFLATAGNAATNVTATATDSALCEASYVAYAWPQAAGRSGVRAFAIDIQATPYAIANNTVGAELTSTTNVPAWDDLFNAATSWASYIDEGAAGQTACGGVWVPTG